MRRKSAILQNLCFLGLLLFTGSCAPSSDVVSTQTAQHAIEARQASSFDEKKVYSAEQQEHETGIAEIDIEQVDFDIPEEVAKRHEKQWEAHQKENEVATGKMTDNQQNNGLLSKIQESELFSLFDKEAKTKKRSSLAIAFQNAFTNGNMMPAGMMESKDGASPMWNKNLTLACVFGGIAIVSIWLAWILFAFVPFPGGLIAFIIFFSAFITFGILGTINLVKGLQKV